MIWALSLRYSRQVASYVCGRSSKAEQLKKFFMIRNIPYTWSLLSSLPQLAQKESVLYSVPPGTPPSLYKDPREMLLRLSTLCSEGRFY